MQIKKGDIYYADLTPVIGSEQGGIRPVLIVQNDVGNYYSPTVIAAAITSRSKKRYLPTHIRLNTSFGGLHPGSTVMLEQLRTIDRDRLKKYIGKLDDSTMQDVDQALIISLDLQDKQREDMRDGNHRTGTLGKDAGGTRKAPVCRAAESG